MFLSCRITLCVLLFMSFCFTLCHGENRTPPATTPDISASIYAEFNAFNNRVRDGKTTKAAARRELLERLAEIRTDYYLRGGSDTPASQWLFPVAGYDYRAIEKSRTHGFAPRSYDFFSGNRHGGHPAYDIFIRDRNQDSRDDKTGKPVQIVSMTTGVVVASETEWQAGGHLRGGKYLWIYDPGNDLLIYYAHNERIFVEPGTQVKPGDLLATMGRSGTNAAKRRSPTHLHFSVLRVKNGRMQPLAVYDMLKRCKSAAPLESTE